MNSILVDQLKAFRENYPESVWGWEDMFDGIEQALVDADRQWLLGHAKGFNEATKEQAFRVDL